jgi:hypothetical protein
MHLKPSFKNRKKDFFGRKKTFFEIFSESRNKPLKKTLTTPQFNPNPENKVFFFFFFKFFFFFFFYIVSFYLSLFFLGKPQKNSPSTCSLPQQHSGPVKFRQTTFGAEMGVS